MSDSFQNLFQDDFLDHVESKKDTIKLKEGERRIVSILFLDISGFTKLSNRRINCLNSLCRTCRIFIL